MVTAQSHDLAGILELIRPLQQGILVERSNEQVAAGLDHFGDYQGQPGHHAALYQA